MVSQMKVNLPSFSNVIFGQGRDCRDCRAKGGRSGGVFALGVRHKKLECFE